MAKDNKTPNTNSGAMTAPPETTALAECDFGDDAGAGFDNVTNADMVLPMIAVLQSNSRIVKDRLALGGQLWVTSLQKGFDTIEIVPAVTDHCYLRWVPRDDKGGGGGFRGRYDLKHALVRDTLSVAKSKIGAHPVKVRDSKNMLVGCEEGTELVEAFEVWCVYGDMEGRPQGFALFSCSSTKIRPYRNWITKLRQFQVPRPGGAQGEKQDVPMFANHTLVRTIEESKGANSYYVPSFDAFKCGSGKEVAIGAIKILETDLVASMLGTKSQMYQAGKELRQLVADGKVKADYNSLERDDGAAAAAEEAAPAF